MKWIKAIILFHWALEKIVIYIYLCVLIYIHIYNVCVSMRRPKPAGSMWVPGSGDPGTLAGGSYLQE